MLQSSDQYGIQSESRDLIDGISIIFLFGDIYSTKKFSKNGKYLFGNSCNILPKKKMIDIYIRKLYSAKSCASLHIIIFRKFPDPPQVCVSVIFCNFLKYF